MADHHLSEANFFDFLMVRRCMPTKGYFFIVYRIFFLVADSEKNVLVINDSALATAYETAEKIGCISLGERTRLEDIPVPCVTRVHAHCNTLITSQKVETLGLGI